MVKFALVRETRGVNFINLTQMRDEQQQISTVRQV